MTLNDDVARLREAAKEPNSVVERTAWANGHRPDNPFADDADMKCEKCGAPRRSWQDSPCATVARAEDAEQLARAKEKKP